MTADRLPPGLTNAGLFDPADLSRVDPEWTLDGEPGWPHLRGFGLLERLGYFLEPATTDDRLTFILRGGDPPTNLAVGFVTNESIPLDEPTTASGGVTPATFLFDPEQSGILLLRDSPGVLCAGRRLRLLPRTNQQLVRQTMRTNAEQTDSQRQVARKLASTLDAVLESQALTEPQRAEFQRLRTVAGGLGEAMDESQADLEQALQAIIKETRALLAGVANGDSRPIDSDAAVVDDPKANSDCRCRGFSTWGRVEQDVNRELVK